MRRLVFILIIANTFLFAVIGKVYARAGTIISKRPQTAGQGSKPMEYTIVAKGGIMGMPYEKLEKNVNEMIARGWEPLGAPGWFCHVLSIG